MSAPVTRYRLVGETSMNRASHPVTPAVSGSLRVVSGQPATHALHLTTTGQQR